MARIRQIKPEFFKSEDVAGLEWPARMLFVGLWTIAAADGRLLDRPRRIAAELFPYDHMDEQIDILLGMLAARELIIRYRSEGKACIQIVNFAKHQKPHRDEAPSDLPPPPDRQPRLLSPHAFQEIQDVTDVDDHSVGENPGKPVLPTASPVEVSTGSVGSGSLGSGSLENGSLEGCVARARDPRSTPWKPEEWRRRFGMAWSAAFHNGARTYGNSDDGKACGILGDLIDSLPETDVVSAQDRAATMFAEFFADRSKATTDARHRFSWFVNRWGGLRVPAAAARASPPRDVRVGYGSADDSKHTETGEQQL